MSTYTPGKYAAEVIDQGFEESTKGTPAFFVQLRILGRYEADGRLVDCPAYERTIRQYLGDSNGVGLKILRADLATLGVTIEDLTKLDPSQADAIVLVGRRIDVTCTLEIYNGRDVERWAIARERKKLSADAIRELAAKFSRPINPAATTSPTGPNAPADKTTL